jgi:glucose/arabinose dehydrogenase
MARFIEKLQQRIGASESSKDTDTKKKASRKTTVTGAALLAVAALFSVGENRNESHAAPAPGITDRPVLTDLVQPTTLEINNGIYVAEKRGVVKRFDSFNDNTPTIAVDIRNRVSNYKDKGLLGMEFDPQNPNTLYLLYSKDAPLGRKPPVWRDDCNRPNGCVTDGELDRIKLNPRTKKMQSREVLVTGKFPNQSTTHSIGDVEMGRNGKLYMSAGDGALIGPGPDYGQVPTRPPITGDPPRAGGALRSQDLETAGDPITYDGAVLEVNPDNGNRRIIAYGLRNPFRIEFRPGTKELWTTDTGWRTWEEINRIPNAMDGRKDNFGWPCYEGKRRQPAYDKKNLPICEDLYRGNGTQPAREPYHTYKHREPGKNAISGIMFNNTAELPAKYKGALLFADYGRQNIRAMLAGPDSLPNPRRITPLVTETTAVDLVKGPGGRIYYPDILRGQIRRIS